ncbi:MAG: lipocalin family protein [Methylotenera sp.]|nr:lipocalin family protein [Methylotenera sp.]
MTLFTSLLSACASHQKPQITTVPQVDIQRFMGPWYVIAAIPTAIETEAFNAIESYKLDKDGTIATTFTFNKGSLDGKQKTYNPRGFIVENTGNARWGMQFIWPIKAEFLIAHLDEAYTETIIARNARDYVWIMARTPGLSDEAYNALVKKVSDMGYDIQKLRRVPHNAIKN